MGTRKQLTGFAGILGGLAWVALGYLRRLSLDETPSIPLSHDQLGLITPAVALLLVFALRGAHKLHEGRAGRWERWSYPVVMSGQALLAATLVMDRWLRGEQEPPLALLYQIAYVLTFLGGLGLAVGFLRARVLPWWARPLPIGVGVGLIAAGITGREVIVDGASWVGLGLAVLVTPSREGAREALTLRAVREAFLSPTTLISGVLAVAVWSLEWQWLVGVFVVLLLYAHEIGHVLAAFWRGVQVKKAPVFLPGFGAFVETAPGTSAWDDAWISLGGPLFGAACALVVKQAGVRGGIPELAHAGDFALLINAINVAPFAPLDGGRVARTTGWLGVLLTIGLGVLLLFQGVGLFFSALIIVAGVQAIGAVRQAHARFLTHVGIFIVYLLCALALIVAFILSGRVEWLPSNRPGWMPSLGDIFEVVFWVYVAGIIALPWAFRPGQPPLIRYGIAALIGWPNYLLQRKPGLIVLSWALLGVTLGVPGAPRLARWATGLAPDTLEAEPAEPFEPDAPGPDVPQTEQARPGVLPSNVNSPEWSGR